MREQIDRVKNFSLNESVKNAFDRNRKIIRNYIRTIKKSKEYRDAYNTNDRENYDYWIKYLTIIHNSLLIEEKFKEEYIINGKEINKFLDLPNTTDFNEIIKLCKDYYDSGNKVRFGVETQDSIEEIRIYLSELLDSGIKFFDKVYFSF